MATEPKQRSRQEIPAQYRWRVEEVYPNDQAWEDAFQQLKALGEKAASFQGTLGESSQKLLAFFQYQDELGMLLDRVYLYASMKKDEDNGNSHYAGLADRIQALAVDLSAKLSWADPELLTIPETTLQTWLDQQPGLSQYRRAIYLVTRQRQHILPPEQEQLLAQTGELAMAPNNVFTMLNNVDLSFPNLKDGKGNLVPLTHGSFILFLEDPDRQVRKTAFEAFYATYSQHKNTLAALQAANVKKDNFYARVRHYGSALESALYDEEIPQQVYDSLIETVHRHLPDFYRYVELRKKAMGLDELHFYDLYAPLTEDSNRVIPYEEACQMVLEGLTPLGPAYLAQLKQGMTEEGWIDVYENAGKTSGAYSTGAYGTKPYVLLNHQDNLNSVFTIAHELGHSMHTFYSAQNQPFIYSGYRIFVAEVASTLNETLLLKDLLQKSKDNKEKAALINYYLDQFRGTVFRQTMFAEFERLTHQQEVAGKPISAQWLCDTYRELNRTYFGPGMFLDDQIALEWARIPHFYRAFYVYKYATGLIAASALAEGILTQGQPAVDRYLAFLGGGSSADPITLLQQAGVDLTQPAAMDAAFQTFREMLDELEQLL